ncbi:FK506-binding protein 15 [Scleropages formosus]|uniref:peptidylprolyl isomerase n=1 Tax=Scleropages formosus TaxID=113540 RepID=A0A8C9RXQ0_SCLFO|nr:FK506-binding protein 15-like [Scleropages formosus]
MFAADDEDGDFLSPTGGAKLASLFGLDQAASQGNESFQYTAPKQPKKATASTGPPGQKPAPPPGAPAVLLATAVHAFQYVNGQYMKQGKLGVAVLGNHTSREYKILLYVSQQKQVTSARIHPGFVFTVQPSNYGTFYDDQRQNWSLMFESEKAAMDFCKQVCLAKANSVLSLDAVLVQDLVLGEGQSVENGDSLEVAYTGWLLQNHAIGQMFDSNLNKEKLLRLKLGAGKVIKGWEEGMLGMRKGGRRFLIVPPSLGYGSQGFANRVPADSTLIFETEIRRVKFAKDNISDRISAGSRDSAASSPAPSLENMGPDSLALPPTTVPPKQGDLPLRAKSNSLGEQLANPDATKAKLISRMAKMGQPMLPFLTGAVSSQPDSSDSEMEDPSVSRIRERPPAPSPQPVQITAAPPTTAQVPTHPVSGVHASSAALLPMHMATSNPPPVLPSSVHAFQPYNQSVRSSQLQPVGQMYPTQTVSYQAPSDVTSFLMTEARQHNTEIRLAVGKVADKIDQLAAKVDDLQKQGGITAGLSNVSMETAMIMHNIQRIIQENGSLKKEVFEKSSKIEEQNRKIGELINQNQRYMEQSNLLMEQRNDSMKSTSEQNQARVLQAERDKVRLTEELASSTARISQLQLEATSHQQRASELQAKLSAAQQESEKHSAQLAELQSQVEELKQQEERVQAQCRTEKQKRREIELKLSSAEEELQDVKAEKESLERTLTDRKRKWQAERKRCDEELEEVRRSSQQEMENLKVQLRRARTSTDQAAAEQLAQLQSELQAEWQGKLEQAVASVKEQHERQQTEMAEQRETLEQKVAQLQDKYSTLKQSRDLEEQQLLRQQEEGEELQALRGKYSALQERAEATRRRLEARVADVERRLAEQDQVDTAGEVKRVMNGVFHSLRGEFDLHETYTGSAVLEIIVSTIKNVTLQLLTQKERLPSQKSENDAEEEKEEVEEVGSREELTQQEMRQNGKREEEKEESVQVINNLQDHPEKREAEQEVLTGEVEELAAEEEPEKEAGQQAQAADTAPSQALGENHVKHVEGLTSELGPEGEAQGGLSEPGLRDVGPVGEPIITEPTRLGPPTRPPPPPNPMQASTASLTEGVEEENGATPFFPSAAPSKPPQTTSEEEEDELSLKGRPPPAPLFGDDDDDDDLDWLG